jgi:hypothetical protein
MSCVKKPNSLPTILKIVTGAARRNESPAARLRRRVPGTMVLFLAFAVPSPAGPQELPSSDAQPFSETGLHRASGQDAAAHRDSEESAHLTVALLAGMTRGVACLRGFRSRDDSLSRLALWRPASGHKAGSAVAGPDPCSGSAFVSSTPII